MYLILYKSYLILKHKILVAVIFLTVKTTDMLINCEMPFYMPQELRVVIITAVYLPLNTNVKAAMTEL